jgi:hypothetical protein
MKRLELTEQTVRPLRILEIGANKLFILAVPEQTEILLDGN